MTLASALYDSCDDVLMKFSCRDFGTIFFVLKHS
ncbi:hypothetical protein AALP_AA3G266200 [Arabis alpina]|uniref:Uncharacterized protein n=1 Tax=Arabis alpina TaxID=50452 RepID=A0A087HBV8_ARAAL|nr:hypothetical protein AALP_AA3G266200 [Arabis alpina]